MPNPQMNTPVSAKTLADIDRERDETTPLRGGPSLAPMELPPDDVDPIVQAMGGHHLQHDFKGQNYWLPDEASAWEFFRRVREVGHEANVADPNTVTVIVRKESKMSTWDKVKRLSESFAIQDQDGNFVSGEGASRSRDASQADTFGDEKEAQELLAQLQKRSAQPKGNSFGPMGGSGRRSSFKIVPLNQESVWAEAKRLAECPVNEADIQEDHGTKTFDTLGAKLSSIGLDPADLKALQGVARLVDRFDPKQAGNDAAAYGKLVGSWKHFLEDVIKAGEGEAE